MTNEEIKQQFVHKPALMQKLEGWNDDLLTSFCDLCRLANRAGLDVFYTKMDKGKAFRLGRKELHSRANTVFMTLTLLNNEVKFSQRTAKRSGQLDKNLINELEASTGLNNFNLDNPINRQAYWPKDYENSDVTSLSSIWKVSHSPNLFSQDDLNWLTKHERLAVHRDTPRGGATKFESIKVNDFVSLVHGPNVFRIVQVTSDVIKDADSPLNDDWLLRKYDTLHTLDTTQKFEGPRPYNGWSPSNNSTCRRVSEEDLDRFEDELLQPYFNITLKGLGFMTSKDALVENNGELVTKNEYPLNQILYGPPGTGKTYSTIRLELMPRFPGSLLKATQRKKSERHTRSIIRG